MKYLINFILMISSISVYSQSCGLERLQHKIDSLNNRCPVFYTGTLNLESVEYVEGYVVNKYTVSPSITIGKNKPEDIFTLRIEDLYPKKSTSEHLKSLWPDEYFIEYLGLFVANRVGLKYIFSHGDASFYADNETYEFVFTPEEIKEIYDEIKEKNRQMTSYKIFPLK